MAQITPAEQLKRENAFTDLSKKLTSFGLSSLFAIGKNGPYGWLWQQIKAGNDTEALLLPRLEDTDEFKTRYKIIVDQRARVLKGEAVTVPTVGDVLGYEKRFREIMLASGLPATFYDEFTDAQKAMASNLTTEQIENRIEKSIGIVNDLSPDIKAAFKDFYGDASDGALFAAVLDPTRTLEFLENKSQAASMAAFGKQQNLVISKTQAEDYATWKSNYDEREMQKDITQVAQYNELAQSNLGESGQILDDDIAFRAGAMGDIKAGSILEDRATKRKLEQSSIGGGALTTTKGIVGA
jgi:hypothetical protein